MEKHMQTATLRKKLTRLQRKRDVILNKLIRTREDQKFEINSQEQRRLVRMIVELENDLEIELATTETIKTGISTRMKPDWDELCRMNIFELKERKQKLEEKITRSRLNQPFVEEEISRVSSPSTSDICEEPTFTSTEDGSQTYPSVTDTSDNSIDPVTLDLKWQEDYSTTEDDDDTYSSFYTSPLDTSISSD